SYDYGGSVGLFYFTTNAQGNAATPARAYLSCAGCWDATRSKLAVGDVNGDARADVVASYDYGGSVGLFYFTTNAPGNAATPARAYLSCAGCWDGTRSKLAVGDVNGDARADVVASYDYGGSVGGLFYFTTNAQGNAATPALAYLSCAGCWDANRGRLAVGDVNGDGKADVAATRDHGGGRMGLWYFTTNAQGSAATPTQAYLSCAGCWDANRTALGQ
ncbi:MAG: VCBS repeat-containing protein, partial [Actinomycetota bacterium]|nr:VCBS repeat-containing protein [Actinomycetota bacterium]